MFMSIMRCLLDDVVRARRLRGWTQQVLATRVGRSAARVSEFERDLRNHRLGRDRLALFIEICDTLDVMPVLVPADKIAAVRAVIGATQPGSPPAAVSSAFDDLFVDLSDDDDDEEEGVGER
ncbi:helix-turn-helix domain-containing protein [Neorhizobium sp. NPDC001467]|uniref:helix-turn-helix domain-containing protein n=1 Tax=Neorhizobium sp. NPDC001467 TaxID=3390595 RepID=UPI003D08E8CD